MVTRRHLLTAGALVPAALLGAAACGPNRPRASGGSNGSSSLRAVWWGNAQRTASTQKVLDAFASAHDGVKVAGEPTDWSGYWDKLATQLAAKDAPDLVQMDEKYLLEYVDRSALLDLSEQGVTVDRFAEGLAELGTVEKKLFAVDAGTIAPVMMANPSLFEQAGVALPDDTTWTWDQLKALGAELTSRLPDGSFGITDFSGRDAAFRVWVRQHGAETFTDDKLGFGADIAASFFQLALDMMNAKATPSASQSAEDVSAAVDQRLFGTDKTALAIYSSNQITAFDAATGKDLKLLRLPSVSGKATDAKLAYQASMYWTITADSRNAKTAGQLVDYLVNDVDAGKILLTERGVPANTDVLAAIQDSLSASDKKAIAYLDAIRSELASTPPLTPKGGSSFEDVLIRHGQDVLAGKATPQEAGQAFVDEMNAALG